MSRRRTSEPHPKRHKNLARRRLKLFCTGGGTHGPVVLAEHWMPDTGRPDIDSILQGSPVVSDEAGNILEDIAACSRCKESKPRVVDRQALERVIQTTRATRVIRWDVSRDRLLES